MKKRSWIILSGLALVCLTACGQKGTPAEAKWAAAKKSDDMASYVTGIVLRVDGAAMN